MFNTSVLTLLSWVEAAVLAAFEEVFFITIIFLRFGSAGFLESDFAVAVFFISVTA